MLIWCQNNNYAVLLRRNALNAQILSSKHWLKGDTKEIDHDKVQIYCATLNKPCPSVDEQGD